MADALFEHPRLAALYDLLEPERPDLDPYVELASALGARSALDLGCGTGTFACLLAQRGVEVTAVDPAHASLEVARTKPGADQVHWMRGDAQSLGPLGVELVTMTGNVAQVFLDDGEWRSVLEASYSALLPGGHLVFEVRDPQRRAWDEWTPAQTARQLDLPEARGVENWVELLEVRGALVSFRQHYVFSADGATLTSDSTLCFRDRAEITEILEEIGFVVIDVRDAPDRPGLELVFVAQRPI